MDICFKPSDVTLDLINTWLEKPFITRSQLMISHTQRSVSGGHDPRRGRWSRRGLHFSDTLSGIHATRTISSIKLDAIDAARVTASPQ